MNKKIKVAIIGATGLVGNELLSLLEKCSLSLEITAFASKKSIGKKILFRNKPLLIKELISSNLKHFDYLFFCVNKEISKEFIPKVNKGICIDLSSAFRQDNNVPLVIPEINKELLEKKPAVIASPNCTTTIMLLPIFLLHRYYQIKNIVVTSYQAASGGGYSLMHKLIDDTKKALTDPSFITKSSYGFNLFLHNSEIDKDGYLEEEKKLIFETKKILEDSSIHISPTCVRVPVMRAHSLSLNISFKNKPFLPKAKEIIKNTPGVIFFENYDHKDFPTPLDATNNEKILCARLRQDKKTNNLELWVVGDQLLKGAALNAYQIFQSLISLGKKTKR